MNSFNLITKDQETKLLDNNQPEIILDLMKFIYIILGEEYEHFQGNEIIKNMYETIFPKLKVDSLSKSNKQHYICIQ
jgi:hypothetical protein